jgi:GNAT superfamily N-acetyltransferase
MTHTSRDLGDGLRLRSVAGPEDIERVAAFDALIHGEGSAPTWRAWMTTHPYAAPENWLLVEDAAGSVVASLCLLPWRLSYAGVELRAGEMGVVGTLKAYRGRGLQRALSARFDELLRAGGYLLSHIQGIPYFYRQFGYEYAAPLEAWWRLELHMGPGGPPAPGHSCRPATPDDVAVLARLYAAGVAALDVAALRDEAVWRYLLSHGLETETAAETWLVIDGAGAPAGYFRVACQGFGEGLIVAEASQLGAEAALAALAEIRRVALERGKPFVRLNLPASSPLVALARGLGAHDGGAYAWQVRLPDPAALLRALAPALERRVAASIYAGLTRDVVIDLYRGAILLRFQGGRLSSAEAAAPGGRADLRLPPALLAPLLLGHRSLEEIAHMYPDAAAPGAARPLVEALFPKLRAWLYQPY